MVPITNHYYQPQFIFSYGYDEDVVRTLPFSINTSSQLQTLNELKYVEELALLSQPFSAGDFCLNNGSFEHGDADLYYLMIRNYKPKKIIEIGCGHSTKLALKAMEANAREGYKTELICIEPFEHSWLQEQKQITYIQKRVEEMDVTFFNQLQANDILFIDSSHIIRPENDVLFEYLQLLPSLNSGVIIHIHDIFTPRHYPIEWSKNEFRFWNEQYLLEAFLANNSSFKILYTLNHLKKTSFANTKQVLVNLTAQSNPGSFWMQKI